MMINYALLNQYPIIVDTNPLYPIETLQLLILLNILYINKLTYFYIIYIYFIFNLNYKLNFLIFLMNYDDLPNYSDKDLIEHDLTIWGTIIIISNLVHCKINNKDPFNSDWFYYSLASLFGLSIHSLITSKLTIYIIKKFNIKKYNIKLAIADTVKWMTVYILNNIIFTYIKNKNITFDDKWFKLYGGIILGYIIFDLFIEKDIYNSSNKNPDFTISIFKSALGIFVGYFITYGYVHTDFIHMLISIEISLIFYYFIVKKFIPSILI
jgi:hypothetical protein